MEELKDKVVSETTENAEAINANQHSDNSFEAIVAKLSANKENKTYRGLKVRNVIVNLDDEELPRITLVVNQDIDGYVAKDDGYVLGKTRNIFTSAFALAGVLKEDENVAVMANHLIQNPKVAETLFSGAYINVIQVPVKSGAEYRNPFSTKDDVDAYVSDHDWFSNLVVGIKLGAIGNKVVDKFIDRVVDRML